MIMPSRWAVALVGLAILMSALPGSPARADGVTPPSTDGPTVASAGIYIVDITGIDETASTFDVEFDVVGFWQDPRVAFEIEPNGSDRRIYLGPAAERALEGMWRAQVSAVNAVGQMSFGSPKVTIFADGRVSIEARMNAVLRAPLDFRRFPLDRQALPIHLESFAWNRDAVQLQPLADQTGFDSAFDLQEWTVEEVRTSVSESLRPRDPVPFSRLSFEIEIQRKSGFYLWKVLVPLFIIVSISWVVFWMSAEGLGRRAGVSVTGILTVIAFQFIASESLPRVAYLTIMDKIILLSVCTIAATLLVSVLVDRAEARQEGAKLRIDRFCRWAFPILYFGTLSIFTLRI